MNKNTCGNFKKYFDDEFKKYIDLECKRYEEKLEPEILIRAYRWELFYYERKNIKINIQTDNRKEVFENYYDEKRLQYVKNVIIKYFGSIKAAEELECKLYSGRYSGCLKSGFIKPADDEEQE